MDQDLEQRMVGLTLLLRLGQQARQLTDRQALFFQMVNATHAILPYRQAILWQAEDGEGRVTTLSGLTQVEPQAPFILWLNRFFQSLGSPATAEPIIQEWDAARLGAPEEAEWNEWLPPWALVVALATVDGKPLGWLLLVREEPWTANDLQVCGHVADLYGYAWENLWCRSCWQQHWQGWRQTLKAKRTRLFILLLIAVMLLLPVRQSVLAPAEVTAHHPTVVRAPLEGVIERILVQPNASVTRDQPLLTLDPTTLQNRLDVARKEASIIEAKHRQANQQAFADDKNSSMLNLLAGEFKRKAAEITYLESLLERIQVRANQDGIVLFEEVNDWIGKPVVIGEKIMEIADPTQGEVTIHLPVADAIHLPPGAEVMLFLNVDPHQPVTATLRYANHKARPTPDGVISYRLKADFGSNEAMPRIGMKGTAKIYGERTILIHYLLRRPLAALRLMVGI